LTIFVPEPTRPVLRYHGGKWLLAPWIISCFPPHRTYVEPFGGAASVLLRKRPCFSEIYNDLDRDVVNLFQVLRDAGRAQDLLNRLRLTPFARAEFESAYELTADGVERARRLVVRSFMGFGSDAPNIDLRTGFRAQSPLSGRSPEKDWQNYPAALERVIARLRDVVVECRPAMDVMAKNDAETTLHYVDPPYMPETRSKKSGRGRLKYHAYAHEMTTGDHLELLAFLSTLAGMVVLSGYPHPIYDDALPGWRKVETGSHADGGRDRTEVLWLNPACAEALGHGPLFNASRDYAIGEGAVRRGVNSIVSQEQGSIAPEALSEGE
jgi:DNA adenine methylase